MRFSCLFTHLVVESESGLGPEIEGASVSRGWLHEREVFEVPETNIQDGTPDLGKGGVVKS